MEIMYKHGNNLRTLSGFFKNEEYWNTGRSKVPTDHQGKQSMKGELKKTMELESISEMFIYYSEKKIVQQSNKRHGQEAQEEELLWLVFFFFVFIPSVILT